MYRGFWLGCFVLSVASPALAAELQWDAPEGCPDVQALERESEQTLGEPLANYPLSVVGHVTQDEAQLRLSLRISLPAQAEARERELQAASCQELLEAAAVAIALAAAESGERTPPTELPQNTEPREPPPRAAAVEVEQDLPEKLEISVAGTSVWGVLPQLGFGAELQLAWVKDWLRIGLAATWSPERSMTLRDDLRATFGTYFLQVLLCSQRQLARAQLFGCATGALGQLIAHPDGSPTPRDASTPWRGFGVRLGVTYPILPPLELTASLAVVAPLTRPRYYAQPGDNDVLYQPAPVNASLLLGVLFSL